MSATERRHHISKWIYASCDCVYDPKFAFLAHGAAPGATLGQLPDDWCCPDCGAGRGYFLRLGEPGGAEELLAPKLRPTWASKDAALRGAA